MLNLVTYVTLLFTKGDMITLVSKHSLPRDASSIKSATKKIY